MTTLFIIHQQGQAPRVGYPIGDKAASLRKWKESHPGSAIYVLQAHDVPAPGTAVVVTAEEFLAIDDAMRSYEIRTTAMTWHPSASRPTLRWRRLYRSRRVTGRKVDDAA
jgi:hypothetical protein